MKKTLWGAFALVFVFQTVVFATVTVGKGTRSGKWRISQSEMGAKGIEVGPQEPLPVIPDGSSVLVQGNAELTTTGKSTVYLIEAVPFKLLEDTTCKRTTVPGTTDILVEVSAGKATVTQPDKRVLELDAGDQVRLTKAGNVDVVKGEVVLSESSGKTTKFAAGKSLEGFFKISPAPLKVQ
jgi:uncharacterized cupin superfamily protein